MKFTFTTVSGSKARFGKITELPRIPENILETPLLLFTTRAGNIPHVSHEVLQYLTEEKVGLQMPLPTTVKFQRNLKGYTKGISNFVGLKEYPSYCSVQDPASATPEGFNKKSFVSVWSYAGKVLLDAEKYMDIMEAFRPDMYQVLCDGDTNINSTKKRCSKAVENTEDMFDVCLKRHLNSEALKGSALFAVIEGGYESMARKKSIMNVLEKPVQGFVIDGLHNNGKEVLKLNFNLVLPILRETLSALPEEKLRAVHGCWHPQDILSMVDLGVDIFDSSLASYATEEISALVFKYEAVPSDFVQNGGNKEETTEILKTIDKPNISINLKDLRFVEDFSPILEGCQCLTCRNHTKAYIHYLASVKELIAYTLLMIHNLHHYMEFFKFIRKCGKENKKVILS